MTGHSAPPDLVPVLSPGKHRNPRKGACFMEMASFLAGEKWSDHPACTHPLLAALARMVNDVVSEAGRTRLVPMIPDVIGVTTSDPRADVEIALTCARTALPVAALSRQHVLAVGALTAERVLADLDGRPRGDVTPATRAVLAEVPEAERWAREFTGRTGTSPRGFRRIAAPNIVGLAVEGIANACVDAPDDLLVDLLRGCIDLTRAVARVPQDRRVRWPEPRLTP